MTAAQPQDEGQQPRVSDSNRQRDTHEAGGDSTEQPQAHDFDHSDNMATGDFYLNEVVNHEAADFDHSDGVATGSFPLTTGSNRRDSIVPADDELDFSVRTGVFHREGEGVEEGPAVDLSEFEFDEAVLAAIEGIKELEIEVPRKPERNFTIVDEGLFDNFHDIEYVGHGSFGVVLKATDMLGREVAIKILTSEREEEAQRFTNEAKITAQLGASGPDAIIKIYERDTVRIKDVSGNERNAPFTTMEFIDRTLSGTIKELEALRAEDEKSEYMGTLKNALAVHLVLACRGIEHAHQKGILHRDIKPDNIATSTAELGERTRVLDWGLGKRIADSDLIAEGDAAEIDAHSIKDLMTFYTQSGSIVGSPPFMSPEQADPDRVEDARSDVFALGATMYEILTGEFPHKGTDGVNIVLSKIEGSAELKPIAELNPWVPRPLRLIVEKAMAEDATERYQTAEELAKDIERYYNNQQVKASELLPLGERLKERAGLFLQRHHKPLTVATLIVSSVVPVSVWGISKSAENSRANDRAVAVATVLDDVDALPITDADFGIRQIDQMLQKTEGEEHETVLAAIAELREKREELEGFVEYREAERAKYGNFVKESNEILGSMTFAFRDPLGRFDSTHDNIEALLEKFDAKDNPAWKDGLDSRVFTEAEIEKIEGVVFNLQVAAVLRVLPVIDTTIETRVALVDEENRIRRANAAVPFLERARRELSVNESSFALDWAEQAVKNLSEGKEYPEPEIGNLNTEIDFYLATWVRLHVQGDYIEAEKICREGLKRFEDTPLLLTIQAQVFMYLDIPGKAVESIALAETLLGDTPSIGLLRVIAELSTLKSDNFSSYESFLVAAADFRLLCDEVVDRSQSADKSLQFEALSRRFRGSLELARALNSVGTRTASTMQSELLNSATVDLERLQDFGIEYFDVRKFARCGRLFASFDKYDQVSKVLSVIDQLIERFPSARDIALKEKWYTLNMGLYYATRSDNQQVVPQLRAMHDQALAELVQTFDEEALLAHVANYDYWNAERSAGGSEYARTLAARADELSISEDLPTIPRIGDPPFKSVAYSSSKGPLTIRPLSNGIRWIEEIRLSNGSGGIEKYYFTQVAVDDQSVTLLDRDRGLWMRLYKDRCEFARDGQEWRPLYRNSR